MMAGIAVRAAGASLTDRDDSSLSPVGRTARTPRKASPSLLHDSALCTASTIHAKTPISSSSDQGTINSSSMSTPTGTKLAVTTTYDSSAGGEEDSRQDLLEPESLPHIVKSDKDIQRAKPPTPIQLVSEKEIALSQLQELEVAIKVRKGSKVDGRKVRWIEYRARKAEEEKNNNSSSKPKAKSQKSKSIENDENALSVNNNNNNSENTENMKGEVINTPLVLESMKLQFLQGTENIEGSVTNGSNSDGSLHKSPDAAQKRKSGRTRRSQSTPKENKEVKRSPKNASKNSQKSKSKGSAVGDDETEGKSVSTLKKIAPKEATLNGTSEILSKIENVPTEDVPSITPPAIVSSFTVKSPATSPGLSEILPPSVRPVYKSVTKGLREVRKTENGVEVETVKNDNGVLTSSSGTENKLENDFKCMTVTPPPLYWNPPPRARSADSVPLNKKKSVSPKKVKTTLSKSNEHIDSEIESIANGHHEIEIDSQKEDAIEKDDSHLSTEENVDSPNKTSPTNNEDDNVRRRRGRPPKRKLNLVEVDDPKVVSPHGKSSKKIETVIADVHNTMNGEPQSVIPVSRPVLRGKKVSMVKRLVKWSQEDAVPDVDSSDIIHAKTSVKKGSKSSENASKGKEKSSRLDTKKKMTSTKKGSAGVPLEDSEISSTTSASLSNQIQTTSKSKSTKSVKGVRLGLSSSGKSVGDAKITPVKASPQNEEETDVSDNEQKGKYLGKGEKSLAGRVIRRSEPGKSPEHTKQPLNKSPSTKDEIASSKESLTPKTSSTAKGASQKSSNTLRSSISRSISLENLNVVKDYTKTDDDAIHKIKPKYSKGGEGTNLRKSSSFITENSDGQIGHVEDSPKRSQSRSKNSPGNSISPNKGKQAETASEDGQTNEELPTLGDSEDKELLGLQKTMKGKGKARNKESNMNIQRDLIAEDKTLTPRRASKKTTVESSKVRPKKNLDNKIPQGVEEAPEATTEGTPLDKVSGNSKVCVEANTEKSLELDKGRQVSVKQGKIQKELGLSATKKTQKDESTEIIMSKEITNELDKGRQVSVKQGKGQKELVLSATKKTQKDESAEIIMSREVTNELDKGRQVSVKQGKGQKELGLSATKTTQKDESTEIVKSKEITNELDKGRQVSVKQGKGQKELVFSATKKTQKDESAEIIMSREVTNELDKARQVSLKQGKGQKELGLSATKTTQKDESTEIIESKEITNELDKGRQVSLKQGKGQKELVLSATKKTQKDESAEIIISREVTNELDKGRQGSVKQGKGQKELGLLATKTTQKDESTEIIESREITNELDKGRQGKGQKELGFTATKKTQRDESAELIMNKEVTNVLPLEEPEFDPKNSEQPVTDKAQEIKETLQEKVSENVPVPDSSKFEMLASNCKVQSSKAQIMKKRKISNEKPSTETVTEVNVSTNTVEERSASFMSLNDKDELIENLEEDKVVSSSKGMENTEHLNMEQSKEIENLVEEQSLESNMVGGTSPHDLKQRQNEMEELEKDCKIEIKFEETSPAKSVAPAGVSSSSGITSSNVKSPMLSPQHQGEVVIQPEETGDGEKKIEGLGLNKSHVIEKNDDSIENKQKNYDLTEYEQLPEPGSETMDNQIGIAEDTSKSVENSSIGTIDKRKVERITEDNLESNQRTVVDELNVSVCSSENSIDTGIEMEQKTKGPELSTKVFYANNENKTNILPTSENLSEVPDNKIDIGEGIAEVILADPPKSADSQNDKSVVNVTEQVCETQSPLFGKSKEKVPRILKQLFLDEGVQNMLKSMSDESVSVSEGSSSESSVHKLRPKRPTEPMLASSPELDGVVDALFPNTKKRKRWSELDTLYMDEGVLNLLTSIDSNSRRAGQDDAASDISQASSVRSVKTNKSSKSSLDISSDSRKRKLSGASTVSNTSTKSMQPPESKKICLEQGLSTEDPYDYNTAEETIANRVSDENYVELQEDLSLVSKKKGEDLSLVSKKKGEDHSLVSKKKGEDLSLVSKKKGRPTLPLPVKQKNKAIRMQLKVQKNKPLGGVSDYADQTYKNIANVEDLQDELEKDERVDFEEHVNLAELQGSLRKEKAGTSRKDAAQPNENLKMIEEQEEPMKNKTEFEEDNLNLAELQDTLRKEKATMSSNIEDPLTRIEQSAKSIPPLKIKLASDSVTISHISKPTSKKTSSFIVEPPKTLHELQSLPSQTKSQPYSSPAALSGTGVMQKADMREQPRPSTSTASVHLMPHQKGMETMGIPGSAGLPSLVRSFDFNGQGRGRARVGETLRQSQRASVRQSEANNHYRDIALRKFNNFTQIIMSPSTTKMKNSLNSRVLRELCEALNILRKDESVRMVLLTATGPTFCQGVDLTALQHPNLETRKKNAENLVRGIKEFLRTLVQFPKPIVAGVNGNAMGLGVTMLPLFDLVIVNDKAEFYLPYAKLGQIPEGGATYTFPNLFGKLKSMQLFLGHKVTASMALEMGLASESIWPATYQQELIPKVALLATQSAQSMEATKALMNHHLITKLELSLESECRLLLQHWTSPHFALLCKRFLDSHHIHLQKPVTLPL